MRVLIASMPSSVEPRMRKRTFSHVSAASRRRLISPALNAARPNWYADEPAISVRSRSKKAAPAHLGAPQRAASGRRRRMCGLLGHTWTITASPCPPPEQIAAQP